MASFDAITALIPTLNGRIGAGAGIECAQAAMVGMRDADVVSVVEDVVQLGRFLEQIGLIGAGIIAVRSRREAGHSGLAQRLGHRSAASLVQQLTGVTKGEAARQVRVGEALIAPVVSGSADGSAGTEAGSGAIGDPHPASGSGSEAGSGSETDSETQPDPGSDPGTDPAADAEADADPGSGSGSGSGQRPAAPPWHDPLGRALRDGRLVGAQFDAIRRGLGEPPEDAAEAWSQAAAQLIDEASRRTVEELLAAARAIRDLLDPDVFGTRQAGLRLVRTLDPAGKAGPVAHTEDGLTVLPGPIADRRLCEAGAVSVTVDSCGNPLDVGREHRLFTPRQRIALAIRDGGCRWTGCDRPASYCEAHHIDPYSHGGRTDIDRGILLCRFHHMQLHHGQWRITRPPRTSGIDEDFVLHSRDGEEFVLHRRLALTYAWAGIEPPPKRFATAA